MLIAQSFAFAVFAATVTDPNTAAPISVQTYQAECPLFPQWIEHPPITNPVEAYVLSLADPTTDCRALIAAQIQALPAFTSYRAAIKRDGASAYGPLSTIFAVVTQEPLPEPDPPPPPPVVCYDGATAFPAGYRTPDPWQWRVNTVPANRSRLEAAGWLLTRVKKNKTWEWWSGRCEGL